MWSAMPPRIELQFQQIPVDVERRSAEFSDYMSTRQHPEKNNLQHSTETVMSSCHGEIRQVDTVEKNIKSGEKGNNKKGIRRPYYKAMPDVEAKLAKKQKNKEKNNVTSNPKGQRGGWCFEGLGGLLDKVMIK